MVRAPKKSAAAAPLATDAAAVAVDVVTADTDTSAIGDLADVAATDTAMAPVDPAPVDPAPVAAQLVEGVPNADLIEAYRRSLEGGAVQGLFEAMSPQPTTSPQRLGHVALMDLDHDGEAYPPFSTVFVTEKEFDRLKALSVFEGWWEEGEEES